jgi:hypothetical protein
MLLFVIAFDAIKEVERHRRLKRQIDSHFVRSLAIDRDRCSRLRVVDPDIDVTKFRFDLGGR